MKKRLLITALMVILAQNAHASWSIFEWGNNHHNNHRNRSRQQEPVSVPEPASIILLGSGIVALIAAKKRIK